MQGIPICCLPQFLRQGHAFGSQISLRVPIGAFSPHEQSFSSSSTAEKYSFIPLDGTCYLEPSFIFSPSWHHCSQLLLELQVPPAQNPALFLRISYRIWWVSFHFLPHQEKNPEVWEAGSGYRGCSIDKRNIFAAAEHISAQNIK